MYGCEVTEPRLRCVLPFEAAPAEVGTLRRAAVAQLRRWGVPVAHDEAALLVTELATNVVKHVGAGASAALILEWRGERLRLELHDKSSAVPALKAATRDEECGRGLQLLDSLAVDWGSVLTAGGKSVWCEVSLGGGQGCRRVERAAEMLENYQVGRGERSPEAGKRDLGMEESAVKLIADLLHWTAAQGRDPDDILDRAQMCYEAEAA
ncbi:ATP-binding protein [Streptomyces sp. YIM S03343]